jgi:hypothetical protein
VRDDTKGIPMKRIDSKGRVWVRHEAEGCWTNGEHVIGCAGRSGSKWQVWGGPNSGWYEFDTLKAAMESCE